jgi:hypothetical protein
MDNDGFLEAGELRSLCADWCAANGIRKPGMTTQDLASLSRTVDKVVAQMLATFDKNGDGRVSHEEFFGELKPHADLPEPKEATPELSKEKSIEVAKAEEIGSPKKHGFQLSFRRNNSSTQPKPEPKPNENPYAIKLRSTSKPNDFHGMPAHERQGSQTNLNLNSPVRTVSIVKSQPMGEEELLSWARRLEAVQTRLEEYALELAKREAALVEREAKVGILSDAPGVTAVMYAPQIAEDEKLQTAILSRKKAISVAVADAPDQEAAHKAAMKEAIMREQANKSTDNYGTLI